MKAYRICAKAFGQAADQAFSGAGGLVASARWHTRGRRIVYTAESLSLAALEILVRLKSPVSVAEFVFYSIEVPDRDILRPVQYPGTWQKDRTVSRHFGDSWLAARSSAAMMVPAVVSPGEWNLLINPAHPRFSAKWDIEGPLAYAFDHRLFR